MANLILRPEWYLRESEATAKTAYENRRHFIKKMGLGAIALTTAPALMGTACSPKVMPANRPDGPLDTIPENAPREGYPALRNAAFTVEERATTDRVIASSYNNFYEFISQGNLKLVWPLTGDYNPYPWTIEVEGLVQNPLRLDLTQTIAELGLEERLYRFRCVEAWAMTVPWTGFPLRKLIEKCAPLSTATHVAFISVNRPEEMPGIKNAPWWNWPYYEGLRMEEAMNDLAFVATGMYGEPLPKQNGSPLRLVLPWKYGFKGAKSVVKMVFTDRQPPTFWNEAQPREYSFLSNVNPHVPHPRWSQASERLIGQADRRVPTQLFNGYAQWVGDLYPEEPKG